LSETFAARREVDAFATERRRDSQIEAIAKRYLLDRLVAKPQRVHPRHRLCPSCRCSSGRECLQCFAPRVVGAAVLADVDAEVRRDRRGQLVGPLVVAVALLDALGQRITLGFDDLRRLQAQRSDRVISRPLAVCVINEDASVSRDGSQQFGQRDL
jgi:hypothetical protein